MTKVFLDTDVLLDFLTDRQPFNRHAQAVFVMADSQKIEIMTSSLSLMNANYILRKLVSAEQSNFSLTQILALMRVCPLSRDEILQGLSLAFKDLEDGVQYATAVNNKADVILSRNIKDFTKSLIPVMTPELYLKNSSS